MPSVQWSPVQRLVLHYNSDLPLLRHSSEIMLKDSNGFDLDHDLGQDQGPIGIAVRT